MFDCFHQKMRPETESLRNAQQTGNFIERGSAFALSTPCVEVLWDVTLWKKGKTPLLFQFPVLLKFFRNAQQTGNFVETMNWTFSLVEQKRQHSSFWRCSFRLVNIFVIALNWPLPRCHFWEKIKRIFWGRAWLSQDRHKESCSCRRRGGLSPPSRRGEYHVTRSAFTWSQRTLVLRQICNVTWTEGKQTKHSRTSEIHVVKF